MNSSVNVDWCRAGPYHTVPYHAVLCQCKHSIRREPIVREADGEAGTPALVADLAVHGVCIPQTEALFDIRVTDAGLPSHPSYMTVHVKD